MDDDIFDVVFSAMEEFAKAYIIGMVIWWIFLVLSWPFLIISRLLILVFSLGNIRLSHKQALKNDKAMFLAFLIFIPVFFYGHIVYGAKLYSNLS